MEDRLQEERWEKARTLVIVSLIGLVLFFFIMTILLVRDAIKDHECWEQGYLPESCQQFIPWDEKENN
jgi:hypothetical protein